MLRFCIEQQLPREARECVMKDIRKFAIPVKVKESPREPFKMTKFKRVPPVLHTQPTRMT